MARYAQFDPSIVSGSPVIGWYDTSVFSYSILPESEELIEVTDAQWAQHFINPNGWKITNGKLVAPTA